MPIHLEFKRTKGHLKKKHLSLSRYQSRKRMCQTEIGLCHIEALLKKVHVTSGAEDAFQGKTEAARPFRICLGRDGWPTCTH